MSRPQNIFEPNPTQKNNQLGPEEAQNDPKNMTESKVKIEGSIKMLSNMSDPKNVFELYPNTKRNSLGLLKAKNDSIFSQN